jgi:hypothetical protein
MLFCEMISGSSLDICVFILFQNQVQQNSKNRMKFKIIRSLNF